MNKKKAIVIISIIFLVIIFLRKNYYKPNNYFFDNQKELYDVVNYIEKNELNGYLYYKNGDFFYIDDLVKSVKSEIIY